MATLFDNKNDDRESWIRIAIQIARRGISVQGQGITIHGPHDETGNMWGDFEGSKSPHGYSDEFEFSAKAKGSKYRPYQFRIWLKDSRELFPILKASQLNPKLKRWARSIRAQSFRLSFCPPFEGGVVRNAA